MADIVNFRLARKARDRKAAERQAAENRNRFGRTKAEKVADRAETERTDRIVEGARLERGDD